MTPCPLCRDLGLSTGCECPSDLRRAYVQQQRRVVDGLHDLAATVDDLTRALSRRARKDAHGTG